MNWTERSRRPVRHDPNQMEALARRFLSVEQSGRCNSGIILVQADESRATTPVSLFGKLA